MILDMELIIKFYKTNDYWISYIFDEMQVLKGNYRQQPPIQIQELAKGDEILSNEELAKDSSLRFSIILDAFKNIKQNNWRKKERAEIIATKYREKMIELSKDREITKNLSSSYKNFLRNLKDELDPSNNLNYTNFRDYSNPLAMIAFINGHISSEKRLTQKRAMGVLSKVLIEDEIPLVQYSKAQTVLLFCINNLAPYLAKSGKKKLIKFGLERVEQPKELFFDFVKKYPNNYIDTLFGREMFIKKFDKFTSEEIETLLIGIDDKEEAQEMLLEKSIILANRLFLKPNSGGTRIFFKHLSVNSENGFSPYFSEMVKVLDNINYNIKKILDGLGSRDEYQNF